MKTYINFIFLFIVLVFSSCTTYKPATEKDTKHEFIQEYLDVTKEDIFERSLKWIAQNFKSAKDVIDYSDKQSGVIIAKGILTGIEVYPDGLMGFTLTLDIKDGKARFNYSNIQKYYQGNSYPVESGEAHKIAQKHLTKLTDEISKAILSKSDF